MMGRQSLVRSMMMGVALAAAVTIAAPVGTVQAASSVVAVVNNMPVTSGEIERSLAAATITSAVVGRGKSCSNGSSFQFAIIRSAAATCPGLPTSLR